MHPRATRLLLTAAVALVPLLAGCTADETGYETLDVHAWREAYEATPEAFLLDVRTPAEFDAGHIENATLVPHDRIRAQAEMLPEDKDRPIFVYCRTGNRSAMASQTLVEMGYTDVTHMDGGITAWKDAGYPVV